MTPQQTRSPVNDVVSIIITAVIVILMAVFFVLAFIAFACTILAFCAWSKPLTIGPFRIEPDQARAFVQRGIFTGSTLLMFVSVMSMALDFPLYRETIWLTLAGGYAIGSIGMEAVLIILRQRAANFARQTAGPDPIAPPQTTKAISARQPEPHEYARWDDEEEFR